MTGQQWLDDAAWRRAELRRLLVGLALAAAFGLVLVRAWPEPQEPKLKRPGDRIYVAAGAPFVPRMVAEDAGKSVVTRREVERYRSLFDNLAARCGDMPRPQLATTVDSVRNAVRGKTGRYSYSRTIADIGFAVELAGDHDCGLAARMVADSYQEAVYSSRPVTEWRSQAPP
jgi:hypothetical protein